MKQIIDKTTEFEHLGISGYWLPYRNSESFFVIDVISRHFEVRSEAFTTRQNGMGWSCMLASSRDGGECKVVVLRVHMFD